MTEAASITIAITMADNDYLRYFVIVVNSHLQSFHSQFIALADNSNLQYDVISKY